MPGIAGETWLEAAVRRLSQAVNEFVYRTPAVPANGDVLTYDSVLGVWIPGAASGSSNVFVQFFSTNPSIGDYIGAGGSQATAASNAAPLYGPATGGEVLTGANLWQDTGIVGINTNFAFSRGPVGAQVDTALTLLAVNSGAALNSVSAGGPVTLAAGDYVFLHMLDNPNTSRYIGRLVITL